MDRREVPGAVSAYVLDRFSDLECPRVIVETGLFTIDDSTLRFLRDHLPGHSVEIEFGLESSDPEVLRYSLGKRIDLEQVQVKTALAHSYGFTMVANIVLGAPLLNYDEQVDDAARSISWALDSGADGVVLFPMNVRKGTLLELMHRRSLYDTIDYLAVVEVLSKLDDRCLGAVSLSWSDLHQTVDPSIVDSPSYEGCPDIFAFFNEFMSIEDTIERRRLVEGFMRSHQNPARTRRFEGTLRERAAMVSLTLGLVYSP